MCYGKSIHRKTNEFSGCTANTIVSAYFKTRSNKLGFEECRFMTFLEDKARNIVHHKPFVCRSTSSGLTWTCDVIRELEMALKITTSEADRQIIIGVLSKL